MATETTKNPIPATALTLRLENILDGVLEVEQATYRYQTTLGEYTIPQEENTGVPGAPMDGRPTVTQYLAWIENAVDRLRKLQSNLDNVIL